MIQGLIFDMDGTIVDNMMIHHRAWQKHLKELGLEMPLEEVHKRIHGVNEEIIARLFPNQYSPEEIRTIAHQKEKKYQEVYRGQVALISGLWEFWDQAKTMDIPMSIGTAAPEENVAFLFEELDISSKFQGVVHAGMVERGKPNPEVYQKAAGLMGLDVKNCLIFEDSPTGAEGAANAGSPAVIILTTHPKSDFTHLTNIIKFIDTYDDLSLDELLRLSPRLT